MSKKTYFITGGGTGGHIYPAIAVADELISNPENTVYYVGNPDNLEYGIAEQKGYNFLPVHVKGMPRKLSLHFIFWGIQLCFAILKSLYYLHKYKPDMIFGTGGYVSAPILIAAAITVGLYLFPISFCIITTGRIPPCSDPITGLKSA